MDFECEEIFLIEGVTNGYLTARAKVLVGWLVLNKSSGCSTMTESMFFIPDPEYKW